MPQVRLTSFETVVPRGTQRVDWLVHLDGAWRNVAEVPSAQQVESTDRGTRLIWQRLIDLAVPSGTWFQRIVTEPSDKILRDPLGYLERDARGAGRRVQRTYHQLMADGHLQRSADVHSPV
jgi:hypothetical protein